MSGGDYARKKNLVDFDGFIAYNTFTCPLGKRANGEKSPERETDEITNPVGEAGR